MAEETEKIITINIREKLLKSPKWKRADQAARILRETLEKKTKTKIKFSRNLNEKIWARSIEKPPSKFRVRIVKIDEKNSRAELVG